MTDRAEFDRVASALALAYRAQPDVAARQMKNSLAFIAATSPFSLVPLHRVILGLRGHDMLMLERARSARRDPSTLPAGTRSGHSTSPV